MAYSRFRRRLLPLLVVTWACGPAVDDGAESGAGTGGMATDGEESDGTVTPGTGGGTSTGSESSGGSTTEEGTTTGAELCPEPEEVIARFALEPGEQSVQATCSVLDVEWDAGAATHRLDCEGTQYALRFDEEPVAILFYRGDVILDYRVEQPFWMDRWLSVRDAESGLLQLAAVSASALHPPGDDGTFFADLAVTEVSGVCEPTRTDCSTVERVALEFAAQGLVDTRVVDGSLSYFELDLLAYATLTVGTAAHYLEPYSCTDLPGAWYEFILAQGASPD